MNLLQNKISHLDVENHTSRRRMKELERELDVCRQDVETQRRLVMLREELLVNQHRTGAATSNSKGKARSVEDTKEEQKRYKQAVEEKKGLHILLFICLLYSTTRRQRWNPSLPPFDLTCPDSLQSCRRTKHYWTNCALSEKQTRTHSGRRSVRSTSSGKR
jgi:hypothetical protein